MILNITNNAIPLSVYYHVGGVMVCVLFLILDLQCGRSWVSSPGWVTPKTIKLVFVASPLSRIMFLSGEL
jgi:hypothetical protein